MVNKVLFVTQNITDSAAYRTDMQNLGDLEGVGTLRWVGDKCYRWVQNRHSAAVAAGHVVTHLAANAANMFKWVTIPAAVDYATIAGVVASTSIAVGTSGASYVDGGYGWVQVVGYSSTCSVANGTATIAVGATLMPAVGLYVSAEASTALNTAPKHRWSITLLEAYAATTTTVAAPTAMKVLLNCL